MAVQSFTSTGNKATSAVKLDKAVFDLDVKSHELIKQAYVAYLANGRKNLAKAKSRGEISGGGRKPWRQKGTGRARFGSSRNPIWRGGGVAFGPTGEESYSHKLNKKAVQQAIRQSLSIANKANKVSVIDTFSCKEGSVKPTIKLLEKVGITGSVLIVVPQRDDLVSRATRNLPNVKVVQANYLNVFDILNTDHLLISKDSLDIIHNWLGAKSASTEVSPSAKAKVGKA